MDRLPPCPPRAAPGRSCTACRKRKIRCDRQQPCGYCTKLKVSCTYPANDQQEEKNGTTSSSSSEVPSRLKRIEQSLLRLEARLSSVVADDKVDARPQSATGAQDGNNDTPNPELGSGRLIQDKTNDRYVTSNFWVGLEEEGTGQRENNQVDPSDASTAHATWTPASFRSEHPRSQHFIFGMSSSYTTLWQLHPPEHTIFALWQVFLEGVDPLVKILHAPSTQRQLLRTSQSLNAIPPAFESLMFAIYFAAVTSIPCDVACHELLGGGRQIMLERYRFGVEQALAKANFMSNPNLTSLQALTLYLICARHSTDKTYVWTMTGLTIRLATKLGLHRDPVALGVSPYASEMRRRLWWQICILDVRTAEENDMDPMICEHSFDTKFPSNLNDSDLDVNMIEPAAESSHRTEMLYSLTRIEISYAARQLVFSNKFNSDNGYSIMDQQAKNDYIDELQRTLQKIYLSNCDMKVPICFLADSAMQMVLTKLKLTLNHPSRNPAAARLPRDRYINLVENSIGIIEHAHALRSDEKYSRWMWLFQKYIEWDAVAFLLHSMIRAPVSQLVERASKAVKIFFQHWEGHVVAGDRRWEKLQSLKASAIAKGSIRQCSLDRQDINGSAMQQACSSLPNSFDATLASQAEQADTTTLPATGIESIPAVVEPGMVQEYPDWNLDDVPFVTQDVANWEMDVDESGFMSWL